MADHYLQVVHDRESWLKVICITCGYKTISQHLALDARDLNELSAKHMAFINNKEN